MKKSIVYSFAALAGFPVVANAIEVNTETAKDASWASATASGTPGTYNVSAGATASQKVTLQPGKYVVKGTYNKDVTLGATGVVKDVKQTENKLSFTVTSKGDVTITFKAKDGSAFTFSKVEVDLDYDFEAAAGYLNGKLNSVKTALEGYEQSLGASTTRLDANNKTAGDIQKKINEVAGTQTYNTYVKYELFKGDDKNPIALEIEALSKKAASDYAVDQMEGGDGTNIGFSDVENNFNNIDPKDPNKELLEPTLTELKNKIAKYAQDQTGDDEALAEIQKQLKDLDHKITSTIESYNRFKANLILIDAAQEDIVAAALAFNNNFTGKKYTYKPSNLKKAIDYGEIYANLDAEARAKLAKVAAKVKDARDANEAGHAEYKNDQYNAPATVDLKADFKNGDLIVKKSAKDLENEYINNADSKKVQLEEQYQIAGDFTNRVNEPIAKGGEAVIAEKKAAAEAAIENFVAQLNDDNNAELAILDKTYAPTDPKDNYTKAKEAVEEFEKVFTPANNYYKVVNSIADAQKKLDEIKLSQYDGDGYTPSTSYTTFTAAIDAKLAPLATQAEKIYTDPKNTTKDYSAIIYEVEAQNTAIENLVKGAKLAHNHYSVDEKENNVVTVPCIVSKVKEANRYLNAALNGYSKKVAEHGTGETAGLDYLLEWKDDNNGTRKYAGINTTDADVITFFTADKKAIEDAIAAPAATLTKANEKLGKDYTEAKDSYDAKKTATSTHYNAVQSIAFDLDQVKADVETLVQKANEKNASYGYTAPFELREDLEIQATDELDDLLDLQTEVGTLIGDGSAVGKAYADAGTTKGIKTRKSDVDALITQVEATITKIKNGNGDYAPAIADQDDATMQLDATVKANKLANADLATAITNIRTYTATLEKIKSDAKTAIDKVAAVNASNTAYETARDKVFGAGKDYDQILATVDAKYAYAKDPQTVGGKKDTRYTDAKKKVDDDLKKLNEDVAKAKADEKLNNSVWETRLENIVKAVGELEATAKKVADNHQAAVDMQDAAQKVSDAIATLPAYDDPVETEYYSKLVKGYTTQLATNKASISNYESKQTAVANKDNMLKKFDDLLTKVKAVPVDAAANLKAYNLQTTGVDGDDKNSSNLDDAQKLYNEVYSEINATDQSTQLPEWNKKLSDIQNRITAEGETVKKNYNQGKASTTHTAVVAEIAQIIKDINDLSAQQSKDYNKAIADDNDARYADFKAALVETETQFTKAVELVDAFANVTNSDLKWAVEYFNSEWANKWNLGTDVTAGIYKYPEDIKKLATKAADEYGKAKSPLLYDPDEKNKQAAQDITGAISDYMEEFTDAIQGTIDENRYDWEVKNAKTDLIGDNGDQLAYTPKDDNSADNKPKEQTKLVNEKFQAVDQAVEDYKNALKNVKVPVLDAMLNQLDEGILGDGGSYGPMIEDAQNAVAAADLQTGVDAYRKMVEPHLSYLATLTGQDEVIKGYKKAVKDYLEKAEASLAKDNAEGTCWTSYNWDEHTKYWLKEFDKDPNVDKAKKMYNNIASIEEVQALLDEVAAEISQYHLTNSNAKWFAERLAKAQEQLDAIKANPGGSGYNTSSIRHNINNYRGDAKYYALSYLQNEAKTALQSQYNKLLSDKYSNLGEDELPDDVKAMKDRIDAPYHDYVDDKKDGGVVKLANLYSQNKLTPKDILEEDKNLSEIYKALQQMYDADGEVNAAALQKLNDNVKALEDKLAQLDEYSDEVQAEVADQKAAIEKQIEGIKKDIEEHQDNADYYAADIQGSIDALNESQAIDQVLNDAKNEQAKRDANAAAYERISTQIEELQDALDQAFEEVSGYEAAAAQDDVYVGNNTYQSYEFRINKRQKEIQKEIDDLKKRLEAANKAIELNKDTKYDDWQWNGSRSIPGLNSINDEIDAWLDDCAHQEADGQRVILDRNWNKAQTAIAKATLSDDAKQQIKKKLDAIQKMIGTWDNFKRETDDGTQIYEAWTEGSLRRLIADSWWVVDEEGNGECLYYENLPAVYELVEAIQAEIDDVNALIESSEEPVEIKGDFNGDGKVTVNDYVLLIDHILDGDLEEGTPEFEAADLNHDGRVDVGDATTLIRIILNGPANAHAREDFENGSNDVNVTTESLGNGVTRLAINLANTKSYVAAQMDVVLPAGVNIVSETLGDRAANHTIASKDVNGVHRILLSNITNDEFDGNDGAVLYIDVETTAAFANGGIAFDNVVFADANGRSNVFSLENGSTTAINGIATEKSVSDKIYDFGGRMMNALKRGFNIVGGKKVYVK